LLVLLDAPTSDPQLVEKAKRGHRAAFESLYRRHVGRVYALCLRMSADPSLADELCQEVFVRAFERIDSFEGRSELTTWLHRLAVNVVLTERRGSVRRLARVEPMEDPEADSRGRHGKDHESAMSLESAIARLPEGARHVFVLYDVEGYKHEEIADLLGVTVGTSKAQLHRARQLLREGLR
jgi:RNA polymerase sigma-70 factor (ECF subfamily)